MRSGKGQCNMKKGLTRHVVLWSMLHLLLW